MDNTIIQQGNFVADGNNLTIPLRSDIDWMKVYNWTEILATNNGHGFEYYWQRGMANNTGVMWYHPAADHTVAVDDTATGFTLINSSLLVPSAPAAVTATTNVVAPVVNTALAGVAVGSVVRLSAIVDAGAAGIPNICGVDFTVGAITPGVDFTIAYNLANVPGAVGAAGFARLIAPDSTSLPIFYPRRRTVCNITAAAQAVVTTTVTHGFTVGQQVRFIVPVTSGMVEMNGLSGTVVAIAAGNFTVDINSAAFAAMTWPAIADFPTTFAEVVPVGEDTVTALAGGLNPFSDATFNTAYLGIVLAGGVTGPAGSNNDVVYWVAGKSFNL